MRGAPTNVEIVQRNDANADTRPRRRQRRVIYPETFIRTVPTPASWDTRPLAELALM
jgi:hypothetical protein